MNMERRKAQNAARSAETPPRPRAGQQEAPYTGLITFWARQSAREGTRVNNLMRFFSVTNLYQAFGQLARDKAKGSDGISKDKYGEDLAGNLQRLHLKMRSMSYRPAPARLILIPKPDGRTRPIAISNFEDKLVQKIAADILTAIYDGEFKPYSFGFRPKKSCHGAIGYLYNKLRTHKLNWVVDIDLKNYFNTIDHEKLLTILEQRIADRRFLRYISRMLKAGILAEGGHQETPLGTPQGSIVSPILANLYLHEVVDKWYQTTVQPELGGKLTRYADDMVAAFATKREATEFVKQLKGRLAEYGLELNSEKTSIVCFNRAKPLVRGIFDFLGFTFYWAEAYGSRATILKIRTSAKAFKKKVQDFANWIKENRSRRKLELLWRTAAKKLTGHYNYYGVTYNKGQLHRFYHESVGNLFRWLNRRSQKLSYTWKAFKMRLEDKPLPQPAKINLVNLYDPKLYSR